MGQVWKVTANKTQGQISSGMYVEIHKTFGLIKPNQLEIRKAITEKYGLTSPPSNISSLFNIEKL